MKAKNIFLPNGNFQVGRFFTTKKLAENWGKKKYGTKSFDVVPLANLGFIVVSRKNNIITK